MKKIFISTKSKLYSKTRSANRLKRKIAYKKWKKIKNKASHGKDTEQRKEMRNARKATKNKTKIIVPENFSFINNHKATINTINKLEKLYLDKRPSFVDISNVKHLDHSAITVLASIVRTFKIMGVAINGYIPKDENLRKLFIESDFFKYFIHQPTNKIEYNIGQNNQMFTTKDTEVNPELGLAVMEEASMTIWNEKKICKGLQRVLLELMQNSNNHAKLKEKGVKHWWLSVNHDKDNNKVSFIFVDYGIGIFESLDSKSKDSKWHGWKHKITDVFSSNSTIFEKLLIGELHKTVTGQEFRGKGLPGIKQVLDRNQISNLHIISNDVFSNVSKNKYDIMPVPFNGTFVYWELNHQNEASKWID